MIFCKGQIVGVRTVTHLPYTHAAQAFWKASSVNSVRTSHFMTPGSRLLKGQGRGRTLTGEPTRPILTRLIQEHILRDSDGFALKPRVLAALTLMIGSKFAHVQAPIFLGKLVDSMHAIAGVHGASLLGPLTNLGLFALCRILGSGLNETRTAIFSRVTTRGSHDCSRSVLSRALSVDAPSGSSSKGSGQSSEGLAAHSTAEGLQPSVVYSVASRGSKSVSGVLNSVVLTVIPTAVELGLILGYLYMLPSSPTTGLMLSGIAASTIGIYSAYTKRITEWRTRQRAELNDREDATTSHLLECLGSMETLRLFGREKAFLKRYDSLLKDLESSAMSVARSLGILNFGQQLIYSTGFALTLGTSMWSIAMGQMPVGSLVSISALYFQIAMPLNFLGGVYRESRLGLLDYVQMTRKLGLKHTHFDPSILQATECDVVPFCTSCRIDIQDLTVADGDRQLLSGINLHIPAGARIAIVGESGSGKSTLLKAIARNLNPTASLSGSMLVNGVSNADIGSDQFRKTVTVVPQDVQILSGSVAYNLLLESPQLNQNFTSFQLTRVTDALQAVGLTQAVARLPLGIDTVLGSTASTVLLSGGEIQRVGVARALLQQASIVMFDEATSALDLKTEDMVLRNVRALLKGKTIVSVAHRLSSIADSDCIIVLKNGRIIEQGTHSELLQIPNGSYLRMWNVQRQQIDIG